MTGVTTLLLGGRLPTLDTTTALAHRDGILVWTGTDTDGRRRFGGDPGTVTVELDGAVVTPAFVDAHVHTTSAGLLLTGLDLTSCDTLHECLHRVRRVAATTTAPVLWGHGWDETRWPEQRPPTRAELDTVVGDRAVYLSRVDVHSALVSTPLAVLATGDPGYHPQGPLSGTAHHTVRRAALDAITTTQRRAAQRAFLDHAAANGIGTVHECAGPHISSTADLADLLDTSQGPQVVGYWGELVTSAAHATEVLTTTGAHGLAGDLFCDGALGSRTAALRHPYTDAPHTRGNRYLDPTEIATHIVACTQARVQAGFHVIGDAAVDAVVAGFALAEQHLGRAALIARRHRLEHVEMVGVEQARQLAAWGVVASVQPLFDAYWGGPAGMYAQRLGVDRATNLNPFAVLAATGVRLAFGSDAPVTAADPWAAVHAAAHHHNPASALTAVAAVHAHTAGGHHAAGAPGTHGHLLPGAPATYAVWDRDGLDPGSTPRCLRTVVHGTTIFDSGSVPTEGAQR